MASQNCLFLAPPTTQRMRHDWISDCSLRTVAKRRDSVGNAKSAKSAHVRKCVAERGSNGRASVQGGWATYVSRRALKMVMSAGSPQLTSISVALCTVSDHSPMPAASLTPATRRLYPSIRPSVSQSVSQSHTRWGRWVARALAARPSVGAGRADRKMHDKGYMR